MSILDTTTPEALVGKTIEWQSGYTSERGHSVPRNGIVRAFIPKGVKPAAVYSEFASVPTSRNKLGNGQGKSSVNDRLLIEVDRWSKAGAKGGPKQLASHWYGVKPKDVTKVL